MPELATVTLGQHYPHDPMTPMMVGMTTISGQVLQSGVLHFHSSDVQNVQDPMLLLHIREHSEPTQTVDPSICFYTEITGCFSSRGEEQQTSSLVFEDRACEGCCVSLGSSWGGCIWKASGGGTSIQLLSFIFKLLRISKQDFCIQK